MDQNEGRQSLANSVLNNTPFAIGMVLLFDSFHLILARWLSNTLHPLASAFWVLGIAAAEFAIFLIVTGRVDTRILKAHFGFFALIGFLVAAATAMNYSAVTFVDAGTASLLSRSSTIFAIGMGVIWLKDRLSPLQWLGAAVALIGVLTISFQPIQSFQIGALLVLASAFSYALHAAIVKRYGGEIEFGNFMLWRVGMTAAILLLFILMAPLVSDQEVRFWPAGFEWWALAVTATVDVVLSRVFYYWSLRRLELSFHSIVLILAPVVTVFWSFLFFGETPTLQTYIGGAIVIAGIFIVNWDRLRSQNDAQAESTPQS